MDYLAALLIMFGVRHQAPAVYHAPVKHIPIVVENDPLILQTQHWGAPCSR